MIKKFFEDHQTIASVLTIIVSMIAIISWSVGDIKHEIRETNKRIDQLFQYVLSSDKNEQADLKNYYLNKMVLAFVDGYDVDINGNLIQSQGEFQNLVKDISNEMLSDGFNRLQIERIKDDSRKIGQAQRRSWDNLRKSLKEK